MSLYDQFAAHQRVACTGKPKAKLPVSFGGVGGTDYVGFLAYMQSLYSHRVYSQVPSNTHQAGEVDAIFTLFRMFLGHGMFCEQRELQMPTTREMLNPSGK